MKGLNVFKAGRDFISSFDRHPRLITFMLKGKSEFKTFVGGIVSIGTSVVILLYAYLMFTVMIQRSDTSKNVTTTVSDLTFDSDTIQLSGSTFMFGFLINSNTIDVFKDETYISFTGYLNTKSEGTTTTKSIPFAKWKASDFPTISSKLLSKISITNFYCPQSTNFSVLGNKFSDNLNSFELKFTRCSGTDSKGNPCKSDSAIDTALNSASLAVAVVNTYYDFDDYNSPIKTFLDDRFFYYFVGGYSKENHIYIQQNSAEQKDNFFRYSPDGAQSSFISIENVKESFMKESSTTKTVMDVIFYKDRVTKSYERQVFGLLDVFGNIGGVKEVLEIA